jgi:hypothetical protein
LPHRQLGGHFLGEIVALLNHRGERLIQLRGV